MAAVQKPLTWFGGFEGVVASRGHTLDLHLLDDERKPLCRTGIELRPVTRREADSPRIAWCLRCLRIAQPRQEITTAEDPPRPDPTPPQLTKLERDYRAALERRGSMLERRLAEWDSSRDADRTRGELAAIQWALRLIDASAEAGVLSILRRARANDA